MQKGAFSGPLARSAAAMFGAAAILAGAPGPGSAPAQAQPRQAFKPLVISGYQVRWNADQPGKPVTLRWSLTRGAADFPDAINCKQMAPAAALATRIGNEQLRAEAEAAFSLWQTFSNITFVYTPEWQKADILIGAQRRPRGVAYANVKYEPVAGTSSGRITHAMVCLNPNMHWTKGFDGNLKTYDVRYVLTHEIGHTLGLNHPGPDGQLMSYKYQETFRTLRKGDVDGITFLYGYKQVASEGATPSSGNSATAVKEP